MTTNRKTYRPATGVHFQRLTDEQSQRIYWACLEILERTGIRLYDQEALDLLKSAGVTATDGNRVRIPSGMVEKALTTVPKRITLFNRDGARVMPIEGYRSYYGPGSDTLHIIDHRSGERRDPVLQDVRDGTTLIDALSNIDFAMSMFVPFDVDQRVADRYQMEVMLNLTRKPILYVNADLAGCKDVVEMAEVVAGGQGTLRQKPFIASYVNVTTGLIHNQEALQRLLFLAGKGLPAAYVPSTQGGVTAPVTPAGALAVSQAGSLAGLVLSQLKREGAPFIMPGWGGNMLDMRTTVQPYADPDKRGLAPDLVHYLGLPMFALAGCSDSKLVDQQAAIEAALTLLTDSLLGGNIVHDLGYLESGLSASLAQLVICDEILEWISHFNLPLEVSEETLALDLIDEVGPDGQFMDCDHTYQHFRERFYPRLFERDNHDGWIAAGGQTLGERAAARVDEILSQHQPEPLSGEVQQKLRAIVERAEASL
jgi:trimethylamine--corrinoid protein Co-methyltransferase